MRDSLGGNPPKESQVRRTISLIAAIATHFASACLPIPVTYHYAPPVVGTYRLSDGRPLVGVPIAISIDDSSCAHVMLRTTTDSNGAFRLPEATKRYSYVVLLPIDPVAPNYHFCTAPAAGDSLRPVFHGWAQSTSRPDSLVCTQPVADRSTRPSCSGWLAWNPQERRLVRQ